MTAFCIECVDPNTGTADTDILWVINGTWSIKYLDSFTKFLAIAGARSISFADTPPPAEIAVTSTGLLFVANSTSVVPLGGALEISSCFGALYSNDDIFVIPSGKHNCMVIS